MLLLLLFLGPAAVCECSRCAVPLALSRQHAEQGGARAAALEETGPGAAQVRVRSARGAKLKTLPLVDGLIMTSLICSQRNLLAFITSSHVWVEFLIHGSAL